MTQIDLILHVAGNYLEKVPNKDIKAPTIVIPEIAFEPDIRGVCNCEGTFEINSNPVIEANIKIKSN